MSFFGRELELIRKRAGYTQYQLAKELNMSRSHINRIESGERNPNKDLIEKISAILKLDSYNINKLFILCGLPLQIERNSNGFKLCFHLALELKNRNMLSYAEKVLDFGMSNFDSMIELHALLANTNLIKRNYQEAIKANQETLKLFDSLTKEEKKKIGITKAEVIHNLGYVYFENALEQIFEYEKLAMRNLLGLENNNNSDLKQNIIDNLTKAEEQIEMAFSLEPDNSHILDQLARLYYRKAEFLESQERNLYFNKSIAFYEKLIYSENTEDISKKQEATIFMALALGKINKYIEAIRLINTIIVFTNLYYLGYYVKSCIYAINSNEKNEFLDLSFNALKEAIKLNPDLKQNIENEMDLYKLISSNKYKEKFNNFFHDKDELK